MRKSWQERSFETGGHVVELGGFLYKGHKTDCCQKKMMAGFGCTAGQVSSGLQNRDFGPELESF